MPGTKLTGFRLRPGTRLSQEAFDAISAHPEHAETLLSDALSTPAEDEETIAQLGQPGATPSSIAKQLGVSLRSLQRRFRTLDLPPPDFWRMLARTRQAAILLTSPLPLSEIAYACGFSDQAHMSREFLRWFGDSPSAFRRAPSKLSLLSQPALGNWTGEQISIR